MSVAVTDAPVDNAVEVGVQFSGVQVKPSEGPAINFTFDIPLNVDLLKTIWRQTPATW